MKNKTIHHYCLHANGRVEYLGEKAYDSIYCDFEEGVVHEHHTLWLYVENMNKARALFLKDLAIYGAELTVLKERYARAEERVIQDIKKNIINI